MTVKIKYPECDTIQEAEIKDTVPFPTYIHHCIKCNYIIMESEWDEEDNIYTFFP
jgi:phage FluMu protein Com